MNGPGEKRTRHRKQKQEDKRRSKMHWHTMTLCSGGGQQGNKGVEEKPEEDVATTENRATTDTGGVPPFMPLFPTSFFAVHFRIILLLHAVRGAFHAQGVRTTIVVVRAVIHDVATSSVTHTGDPCCCRCKITKAGVSNHNVHASVVDRGRGGQQNKGVTVRRLVNATVGRDYHTRKADSGV